MNKIYKKYDVILTLKIILYFPLGIIFSLDHIEGLWNLHRIENHCLYTTKKTKFFIKATAKKYKFTVPKIRTLRIGWLKKIKIEMNAAQKELKVIAFEVKHCPDSVMFSFVYEDKWILHTGDFRIEEDCSEIIKKVRTKVNLKNKKPIVYLDSTFFYESFKSFPTEKQSVDTFITRINDILTETQQKVLIILPANTGYEFLIREIYEKCSIISDPNMKVYVTTTNNFMLSEVNEWVTTEDNQSKIHLISNAKFKDISENNINMKNYYLENFIIFKPTAWVRENLANYPDEIAMIENNEWGVPIHKICYSHHCSYEELTKFLSFLQPKKIYPHSIPKNRFKEYKNCINQYKNENLPETEIDFDDFHRAQNYN